MVDFSNTQITNLIIHDIGNKSKNENVGLSTQEVALPDNIVREYLLKYFITSFKFNSIYSFKHQYDLQLNEVYTYAKNIFANSNEFVSQSVNIAQHLYEVSTHPNIKKGELYVTYLNNCTIDNYTNINVIGIFKCENKEFYLNVDNIGNGYNVYCKKGINIDKLDKGCIIFNINESNGYYVYVVDANGPDSVYWKDNFLKLKEENNDYSNTEGFLKICKSFAQEVYQKQSTEKVAFLNNSLSYFQEHDNFDLNDFSTKVINEKEYSDKFKTYICAKLPESQCELSSFPISPKAISNIKKNIKNFIRLDSNIEIRINPKIHNIEQLMEKGYDSSKNMNFYKIFYKDEK